jgi:deazaflavin-dependent oxidoreductase (nitroreductase family)
VNKRRVSTFASAKLLNPLVRRAARAGVPLPGYVLLETTGRRSGQPRQVPVGKAFEGNTLWIVAEHGLRAAYVRNIQANPRVRVKIGRRWRHGTAQVLEDDDWRERQRRIPNRFNSAVVRAVGTEHVTVRVDLDQASASGAPRPAGPAPPSPRSG